MLFVAVLTFKTHCCCLPWWDSPSVALTFARRSLLVWGSKWCRRAWGWWRLSAGLRARGSAAQGTCFSRTAAPPTLQLPSPSRGTQHANPNKMVLLRNKAKWYFYQNCLCVHVVQPCCWHPVPGSWGGRESHGASPGSTKELTPKELTSPHTAVPGAGFKLKSRHCVGPETSWAAVGSFCCHFPLNGCYFLIPFLTP